MPYGWIDPGVFLEHKGVWVYYTYKNDDYSNSCTYWYTTDINTSESNDECIFDVRDLNQFGDGKDSRNHYEIIKKAIEAKALKLPEGEEYE